MSDHVTAALGKMALDKMKGAGAHPNELAAMRRRLEQLDDPEAGRLPVGLAVEVDLPGTRNR